VRHPLSSDPWSGAGPISRRLSEGYKALCKAESSRTL
jgi:hypothetical protein